MVLHRGVSLHGTHKPVRTERIMAGFSFLVFSDGKYVVLPSGELQIRNVSAEDGFKTYKCRTKHRLTGETKLSATAGRLVITGKVYRRSLSNGVVSTHQSPGKRLTFIDWET